MTIKTISPKDAKTLIDKNEAILIDVREDFEHKQENIPCATLIPLNSIGNNTKIETNKKIIAHCKLGGRSKSACQKLSELFPNAEIYNMEGGIEGWKQAGLTCKSGNSNTIPIERQVQIVAGSLILLGVILGFNASQNFFYLSGIIGAGLIFAGITGFCGMAKLLAKTPWNK